MIHFMISLYDMRCVSNERKNCFVLLDNNAEKSKKQKAGYPRCHFVKQQNFLCENVQFFLWTTAQYEMKYNRLLHFVFTFNVQIGTF